MFPNDTRFSHTLSRCVFLKHQTRETSYCHLASLCYAFVKGITVFAIAQMWWHHCPHFISSTRIDPSYLLDNSVGVIEEGQGDHGPCGDRQTQKVPGKKNYQSMNCRKAFGQNHMDVKGGCYANKSINHLTLERADLL